MLKKTFLLGVVFMCCAPVIFAAPVYSEEIKQDDKFQLGLKYWRAEGEVQWTHSRPSEPGFLAEIKFPVEADMAVVDAEYKISERLFIGGSFAYGESDAEDGGTDTDTTNGVLDSYEEFPAKSNPFLTNINLYGRVLDLPKADFDLFTGWQYFYNDFEAKYAVIRGPVSDPDYGVQFNNPFYYRFKQYGPRLGVRGDYNFYKNWSIKGKYAYSWLTSRGKQDWPDEGANKRIWSQKWENGHGFDLDAVINYDFVSIKGLSLEAGYRIYKVTNKGGHRNYDGTTLNKVTSELEGIHCGVSYKW